MKRLNKLPIARTGYQVRGSLANDVPAFGGADYDAYMGKASPQVRKTMGAVPREEANLEAEGGETLVGDIDGSTFPSFFSIKGPRHSSGGVPMNLPDDTFIFSDTKSMKITDPKILKMFNKSPKKGGYTPAELSKGYDINKYRKLLQDPDSNNMEKKTAEMMIKNYVMKLGALAIAQESKKGFPQGIPVIAKPYMEANKITEADLMPEIAKQQQEQQQMMEQQQGAPEGEMMPQEGAPTEMPSGEPMAQPSMEEGMQGAPQMSEEDMMAMQQQDPSQMQQAPMAMYGMSMGGYEMPFAQAGGWSNQDMINSSPNFYIPNRKDLNKDILKRKYPNSPIGQNTQIPQSDIFNNTGNVPQPPMPQQQYGGDMYDSYDPEAAYGMAMGANSNNYMGRTKRIQGSGPFMAREGIIMGGMNMPLIMSGGGYIDKYQTKGEVKKKTKEQLQKEIDAKKYEGKTEKVKKFDEDVIVFDRDGKKIGARGTIGGGEREYEAEKKIGRGDVSKFDKGKWEASICDRLKKGATVDEIAYAHGLDPNVIKSKWANCIKEGEAKYQKDDTRFFELEEQPETGCQCEDPNKPNYSPYKDEQGNCTCEKKKCLCVDPETGEEVEKELTNGECICEEEGGGGGFESQSWQIPMQWTPQDERNMATALRTRTGIEYPTAMTYQYPEVELAKEEWLSKVQGLQGQAAKNLDVMSRTAGPSTSKQAAAASLQGDVAEGIVNAIASTQARNVGTENQERSMNYQGDIAEGQNRQNVLNQYMDKVGAVENNYRGELNAKDALVTQMMNQGDTNAANIYNLQTEQYGIDPRTGAKIFKTGKPIQPEQPDQDVIAYAQELEKSGLPEDMQELILKQRLSKYGGPILQMGGMVYGDTVYPFYYYE
jgi:hypothetical protein